jgi:hypothetical protein
MSEDIPYCACHDHVEATEIGGQDAAYSPGAKSLWRAL